MRNATLNYKKNSVPACGVADVDACAFILATGITDTTIKNALNDLCVDLKAFGLFSECFAIYPFADATLDTHKYNLIDPRDLDAAYRLDFSTDGAGWTHSADGALPNSLTQDANTFLNMSTVMDTNSHGVTYAYNTTTTHIGTAMGAYTGTTASFRALNGESLTGANADNTFAGADQGDGTCEGVVTSVKTSSTSHTTMKNGVTVASGSGGGSAPNETISLAWQTSRAGVAQRDNKRFCFAAIHNVLTNTQIINMHTAVDDYNTALSRKTW